MESRLERKALLNRVHSLRHHVYKREKELREPSDFQRER